MNDDYGSKKYPEKLTDSYYLVRKEWLDESTQLGKYRTLKNAVAKARANSAFVFTEDGDVVYPVSESEPETKTRQGMLNVTMNVREDCSMNANILFVLKKNSVVEILEDCKNGWFKIKCESTESGYTCISNVTGDYISVSE
ncbi:MAG: SH3 domain-containing protein [Ruminococcus sp.]|nr:SH3 domain-containing protein [Ruminococcus sp.]